MNIESVKLTQDQLNYIAVVNGRAHTIPIIEGNRHYKLVQEWIAQGGTVDPADPPITNAELVDLAGPVLVAFLKAYAQREGITLAQLKNAIVAEM